MSKTLTFEISEDLYESFGQIARRDGKTTEQVALEYLARRAAERRPILSEEERRAAHERFRPHIGAVSLGHPTGADNESIDRDLAREYADTHEETK